MVGGKSLRTEWQGMVLGGCQKSLESESNGCTSCSGVTSSSLLNFSVLLPPMLNGVQPTVTVPNVCPLPNSRRNGCDSTKRWSFQKGLGRESSSLVSERGGCCLERVCPALSYLPQPFPHLYHVMTKQQGRGKSPGVAILNSLSP